MEEHLTILHKLNLSLCERFVPKLRASDVFLSLLLAGDRTLIGLQRASLMESGFTESLLASKKSYLVL